MRRAVIEVGRDTRDLLKMARVDLFADAGRVLNAGDQVLFLLAVWRAARSNSSWAGPIITQAREIAVTRQDGGT